MNTPMTSTIDPLPLLLGFTRALKAAGVPVTPDRAHGFVEATSLVGLDDQQATYWAGRATLCAGPDDLTRFDQVFEAWFDPRGDLPRRRDSGMPMPAAPSVPSVDGASGDEAGEDDGDDVLRAAATATEVLRHRDVAALDAADRQRLAAMFAALRPTAPVRRTARHEAWHRGRLDASRTMRDSLRRMGEPGDLAWRRRRVRPRRVVLLVDVSGSMSAYADALLRLSHRFVDTQPRAEVFTLGTRLTHVTRALRHRDADRALIAAGEAVPDWSGGTRLGETLRVFLDRWGQRGMARGSVVVVFSDGWERGDAALLGEQMARLQRIAHHVVWVNPHRGKPGYEPVQQGIAAALPFVDDFVAGHSMATFEQLVEVVGRA